jgi:hypothetical protein
VNRLICALALVFLTGVSAFAQETRSTIFGVVRDQQGASVPNAAVVIRNVETGTTSRLTTNTTGYYEANLLLPGTYEVTVEASGFKKSVRKGLTLQVSSRLEVAADLEIGNVTDTVSVTGEAPLLETSSVTSGRVLDTRSLQDLPVQGNSALLLVKQTPGVQFGGVNNELGLHSNQGGSDYNVNSNVGGNSWSMDGTPLNANSRRTGYVPLADTIAEFKVETSNFDAAVGQTTGAVISMISKAGTNSLHGTGSWLHWQRRWNGSPFFVKQLYYRNIAAAEAAGNSARAADLRSQDLQPSGRSNQYSGTVGGPVFLPKLYDGRNKLFWFFSYAKRQDIKTEEPNTINRTVPTLLQRQGDFSELLRADATRYQLYDPLSVRVDPNRAGTWLRTPFSGNLIPMARFLNPAYAAYVKLLPTPNNAGANAENRNNYVAVGTPFNWDYKVYQNRMDYNISDRHRAFFRWSYNDFIEDRGDWTYESARGLHTNGLNRTNTGATADWVWTPAASTILDFAASVNQFREGDKITKPFEFSASGVGFPNYIDQFAPGRQILPFLDFSDNSYQDISRGGVPVYTRYRVHSYKTDITHIRGKHSIRGGLENRHYFRTGGGGGNVSGNYELRNTYTRRTSDNLDNAGLLGHEWASFVLGFPNAMRITRTDSYATHNPSLGIYVQDNYRLTSKLSLNLGFRIEWEQGPTERFNRIIGDFDPTLVLPISQGAKDAYARSPQPQLAASQFNVLGGSVYPGANGASRQVWPSEWLFMPRLGVAYTINSKTVLRAGYGIYYDTLNVMNENLDQTNFSRTTSTQITNDAGVNWLVADPRNGRPPITDPFPVRANGTRYDEPTGSVLGAMAVAGRTFDHFGDQMRRARQQRWRLGFQRQLSNTLVVDASYTGSYSDRVNLDQPINALPAQYWNTTNVRNEASGTLMNAQVPNPLNISNFDSLRTSNPLVYQDMTTQGRFTSPTIARNSLLRPFPHLGSDTDVRRSPVGAAKTHSIELSVDKRFSKGFNFFVGYTALRVRDKDTYLNEFDAEPTWRLSNDGRPHRLTGTTIYELPFGRGRKWLQGGVANAVAGGWQLGVTYEYQPGALSDWANLFYYGDINKIGIENRSLGQWFNNAGCVLPGRKIVPGDIEIAAGQPCTQGFEKRSASTPAAYQARVFPQRIQGLRSDMTNQWNANVQKNIDLKEGIRLQLRLDALNLQNRSQFNGPDLNPVNSTFGTILSQSAATNRFIQVQARLTF